MSLMRFVHCCPSGFPVFTSDPEPDEGLAIVRPEGGFSEYIAEVKDFRVGAESHGPWRNFRNRACCGEFVDNEFQEVCPEVDLLPVGSESWDYGLCGLDPFTGEATTEDGPWGEIPLKYSLEEYAGVVNWQNEITCDGEPTNLNRKIEWEGNRTYGVPPDYDPEGEDPQPAANQCGCGPESTAKEIRTNQQCTGPDDVQESGIDVGGNSGGTWSLDSETATVRTFSRTEDGSTGTTTATRSTIEGEASSWARRSVCAPTTPTDALRVFAAWVRTADASWRRQRAVFGIRLSGLQVGIHYRIAIFIRRRLQAWNEESHRYSWGSAIPLGLSLENLNYEIAELVEVRTVEFLATKCGGWLVEDGDNLTLEDSISPPEEAHTLDIEVPEIPGEWLGVGEVFIFPAPTSTPDPE